MTETRCPATTSTRESMHSVNSVGVQCKFAKGHDGDHWGYVGPFTGEMCWPQEAAGVKPCGCDSSRRCLDCATDDDVLASIPEFPS